MKQSIRALIAGLVVVVTLQSCATETKFQTSSLVPAAEGEVKVSQDKNNNYKIDVEVIRLAEPQRLSPSKDMYVLWMETEENGIKNLGQLKTSSGFLSKTLKSSLETVTSFKPKGFIITAEDDARIQYPGSQVVLRTGDLNEPVEASR